MSISEEDVVERMDLLWEMETQNDRIKCESWEDVVGDFWDLSSYNRNEGKKLDQRLPKNNITDISRHGISEKTSLSANMDIQGSRISRAESFSLGNFDFGRLLPKGGMQGRL